MTPAHQLKPATEFGTAPLARAFFERVKLSAQWSRLASDEHFSVDGTLIEAWASHKSFKRKDDDSVRIPRDGGHDSTLKADSIPN
jgi:hypothetical protein